MRLLSSVDDGNVTIELSQLLQWYGGDFGDNQAEILDRVSKYMSETDERRLIEQCLEKDLEGVTVRLMDGVEFHHIGEVCF